MKYNEPSTTYYKLRTFLLGCALGVISFFCIYDAAYVNPQNVTWLFNEVRNTDCVQSYLGWAYYRTSPWTLPLGHISQLYYQIGGITVINTDSIPILAFFFKLISPLLPETFQYLGLWELLCSALQGGFSALLIYRYVKNTVYSLSGSVFFLFSTFFINRIFGHCALSGHFLLLAAWCIWAYWDSNTLLDKTLKWTVLASVSILVHPYLVIMVGVLMAFCVLNDLLQNRKMNVVIVPVSAIVCAGLCFALFGGFYGLSAGINNNLLGHSSANLNTWFNAGAWGKFLHLDSADILFAGEGHQYLGLGILCMIPFGIINFIQKAYHAIKERDSIGSVIINALPITMLIVVEFFISCMPNFYLGKNLLFSVQLPESIYKLFDIFQSNGRFLWLLSYGTMAYLIVSTIQVCESVLKKSRLAVAAVTGLLVLLVSVQFYDSSNHFRFIKQYMGDIANTAEDETFHVKSPFWDDLFAEVDYVDFCYGYNIAKTQAVEIYGIDKGIKFNEAYCARANLFAVIENMTAVLQDMEAGYVRNDTAYIITDMWMLNTFLNSPLVDVYNVDDHFIVVSKEIDLHQYEENLVYLSSEDVTTYSEEIREDVLLIGYTSSREEGSADLAKRLLTALGCQDSDNVDDTMFGFVYDGQKQELAACTAGPDWIIFDFYLKDFVEDCTQNKRIQFSGGVIPAEYSGHVGFILDNELIYTNQGTINFAVIDRNTAEVKHFSWFDGEHIITIKNYS